MSKKNNNEEYSEAGIEKAISELRPLIEKATIANQKIDELKTDIRREIIEDGLVWNPGESFERHVEYHRERLRGHGEAQFLATKLPELEEQASKLGREITVSVESLSRVCLNVRKILVENLRAARSHNHSVVIEIITPACASDEEARELATQFSAVSDLDERINGVDNLWFNTGEPIGSATSILREFRRPIHRLNGKLT
jgi:hypothetical protein